MISYILLCVLCILIQIIFLIVEKKGMIKLSLVFKGLASLMFIILGFLCLHDGQNRSFGLFIITGLILDGIGDVVINFRFAFEKHKHLYFLMGTGFFFLGHIFYFIALIKYAQKLTLCLVCGAIAAYIVLFIMYQSLHDLKIIYKAFGLVYITMLFLMTSIAVGNMITALLVYGADTTIISSTGNLISTVSRSAPCLYGCGAILFACSDILLIYNNFGQKKRYTTRVLNLVLYYLGQLLFAMSLAFV